MLIDLGEVADAALASAIAAAGRRIGAALGKPRGRRAEDLDIARWLETSRLTDEVPDLPDLSPALRDRLAAILNGDEIQAALQELLAARLTDAPETDAAQARGAVRLTLSAAGPDADRFAEDLAGYYDDQISALAGRLGVYEPQLLAQIRSEAFSARMIAVLNAIERHTAALTTRPGRRAEAGFLSRYRRHVTDQHGMLEPPDFDRRRRVPIQDIYVSAIITEDPFPERTSASRPVPLSLDVWGLADRLDRSVLLGDPGGGKTSAAHVLMHHFASGKARKIPFLVTLRIYAAQDPPDRSVVGHIEHTLETFYQCPPPPGLVDLLLLTGRAVIIFDGLDELLDTSRRRDVASRVERFCAEYPLSPVLVISRLVGYDQARLDDRTFTRYRLGGFGPEQIAEYARKWFAQDPEARPGDAETFLAESGNVPDLRSNPLMLALLCILYRGAGSLPGNRAEVYGQCATLLYRKWDARRHIHQDLRAGHLIEPTLRHLAWWLFTRDDAQSAVTERELVAATTEFLSERGFESTDEARDAAREFVEFSRGRMWVFSDVGSNVAGEKLYAFTHRTFLEYFAAAQLAHDCDTPEQLAETLAPRVAVSEWWLVAELAVQIKDRTSTSGARRIYGALFKDRSGSPAILQFLGLCLRSVDPSPLRVRELTRTIVDETVASERSVSRLPEADPLSPWSAALRQLLANCGSYRDTVAGEIDAVIADNIRSGDEGIIVASLRLVASLPWANLGASRLETAFWDEHANDLLRLHPAAAVRAAAADAHARYVALFAGAITLRQALEMPGGLGALLQDTVSIFRDNGGSPSLLPVTRAFMAGWPAFGDPAIADDLTVIGEYLYGRREPPWLVGEADWLSDEVRDGEEPTRQPDTPVRLSRTAALGATAVLLILTEQDQMLDAGIWRRPGPLSGLGSYRARREGADLDADELPDLPVPDEFKQTFRDWAERRVNFTAPG